MSNDFSVNARAKFGFRREFTRYFKEQITAENYIRHIDTSPSYEVTEFNFTKKFSDDELDAYDEKRVRLIKEAQRLEKQARKRTNANFENPDWNPCEVCGGKHPNYECCDRCNLDGHICHFCGENLGHSEVSVCYILENFDE